MAKTDLTAERLRELLHYNPETGAFTWRESRGRVSRGNTAGTKDRKGYLMIRIAKMRYFAHRLAWLYVHGTFPTDCIDHINGVPEDNRISNLRPASRAQNNQNRSQNSKRQSGLTGVWWCESRCLWESSISSGGTRHFVGYFKDKAEAHTAYKNAKARLHTYNPTFRRMS